jgi:hypothetical protein
MTQPRKYVQLNDFSDQLTTSQVPGTHGLHLDQDLQLVKQTTDQIINNLALIQRDDTALRNSVVHPDSLSTATKALIAGNWTPRGLWVTSTVYAVGDIVQSGSSYVCATAHTAGTFATDYAAGKWVLLAANVAADITYTDNIPAAVPYLKTLSDIASGSEVTLFRFMNRAYHAGIRGFTYAHDVSDDLREACAALVDLGPGSDAGGRLYIPYGGYSASDYDTDAAGNYVVNVGRRIHIRGDGMHATRWAFNPAAAASLFRFKYGTAVCYQNSIRDMAFTGAGTLQKTAIEAYDTSGLQVTGIAVYPWTGSNSRALWLRGREHTLLDDYAISADQPVQVSANPNSAFVGCDHFTIGKGEMQPQVTTNHAILIDSGVPVTDFEIRGRLARVLGAGTLKWIDTAYTGQHSDILIGNFRAEQSTVGTTYDVDIQMNVGIQSLFMPNCKLDSVINGIRVTKPQAMTLLNAQYDSATKEFLNITGVSGSVINLIGCKPQTGSTVTMTGLSQRFGVTEAASGVPIPGTSIWAYTTSAQVNSVQVGGPVQHRTIDTTVANSASLALAIGSNEGMKAVRVRLTFNGATKWGSGEVEYTAAGGPALVGSARGDFNYSATAGVGGDLTLVHQSSTASLVNDTGESVRVMGQIDYIQ